MKKEGNMFPDERMRILRDIVEISVEMAKSEGYVAYCFYCVFSSFEILMGVLGC